MGTFRKMALLFIREQMGIRTNGDFRWSNSKFSLKWGDFIRNLAKRDSFWDSDAYSFWNRGLGTIAIYSRTNEDSNKLGTLNGGSLLKITNEQSWHRPYNQRKDCARLQLLIVLGYRLHRPVWFMGAQTLLVVLHSWVTVPRQECRLLKSALTCNALGNNQGATSYIGTSMST